MSEKLSKLHDMLATKLTEIVNKEDVTASELNVVRQFLKDNGIDAIPADNSAMGDLVASLPESFKTSFTRN